MELASKLPVPPLKWSTFVMAGQSAKRGLAPDVPATGILLFDGKNVDARQRRQV
jgi:hypothetical protein